VSGIGCGSLALLFSRCIRAFALALTVAVLCATALVLIVTLSANSGVNGTDGTPSQLVNGFYGATAPASIPPVNFALRNQNGQTISLARYRGQVVVLTFVYSTCQTPARSSSRRFAAR
jgi:cytochrome oxidase Cu insertion factor (SCO1/SenC/PrrC family)